MGGIPTLRTHRPDTRRSGASSTDNELIQILITFSIGAGL